MEGQGHWSSRERQMLRSQGCQLRCLVGFCLLGLVLLTLPVLYLLNQSSRKISEGETSTEKMPEFQKLQGDAPNCSSCTSRMKPRTHLAPAESQPNPNCMPGALPILHWRNDRTSGTDTITYNNGYMMVPEAGDYFVYTQITFFCPDGKCKDMTYCGRNVSEETSITQIISKLSSSYGSQPIQQLATSVYIGEKDKWKKTLYLGGVIQLRRHDKLMVNISNPTLVVTRSPEITFFGAFLI